jgi:hypothetical protein
MQYVERLRNEIISNIRHLEHAPGTQFEEVRAVVCVHL